MELSKFKKNVKSQFGEDGIIEEIFNRIKCKNKICVEFGAWDGEHLSNVWNLWYNKDWTGVLIEADPAKFKVLQEKTSSFPKLHLLNKFVEPEGDNCVDSLLKGLGITENIDLLSIDIDGNDYYILEGLKNNKPRVVIIEYNPTIPPHIEIIQERNEYFGASALSILNLAKSKGYKLAAITDTNLFLVDSTEFHLLGIEEVNLKESFLKDHLVYIITSYDGKAYMSNPLPYKPNLPTIQDIINQILPSNSFINKIIKKRIKFREDSRPKLKTEHKIIAAKLYKD